MIWLWLQAFLLTHAVEIPVGCFLQGKDKLTKTALTVFMASSLTHPLLWFVLPKVIPITSYLSFLIIGEGFVILAEGFFYKLLAWKQPFWKSLLINSASTMIGLVLNAFLKG